MRSILFAASLLVIVSLSFSVDVASCINITAGSTTYDLNTSLSGAPNDASEMIGISPMACIKIAADDVILDCHGFSISGPGADTIGIAINGSRSGIIIRNCPNINGYEDGIQALDVSGSTFFNNTLDSNIDYGFLIDDGDDNNYTLNVVSNNGVAGFAISNMSVGHMEDNVATDTGHGFSLSTVTNSLFIDNNASTDNNGFFIGINSTGNTFSNNRIIGGGNSGFAIVTGSTGNIFQNNNASSNTNWGFITTASAGFNNYTNNYVASNGMSGFLMSGGSGNNVFIGNNASFNGGDGFEFTLSPSNSITGNVAANNSGLGFVTAGSDNVSLSQNNATGNGAGGFSLEGDQLNIAINNAFGNTGNGFSVITGDFANFAINNASNNTGTGYSVISGNLANFAINEASGNGGFGFSVITGNFSNFAINTATGNNGFGFSVIAGGNPNFAINDAVGNDGFGFSVITGDNANFAANTADSNNGFGFSVVTGNLTTFTSNTATNNNGTGFSILGSELSLISNDAATNDAGFSVSGSGNNFTDNSAINNSGIGVRIGSSDNTRLTNTVASGNALAGLDILDSDNTQIQGVRLFGNTPDFRVDGTGVFFNMTDAVFDSPSGSLTGYTNLTLSDTVASSYSIDHSVSPAPFTSPAISFNDKFVNISGFSGNVSMDSTIWSWLDSELGGTPESNLALFRYNGSVWSNVNSTPDTAGNTLSHSGLSVPGVYALVEVLPGGGGSGEDGGGSGGNPDLSISFDPEGNEVTVTSEGSPVPGATVRVNGSIIGTTDSNGMISFDGCGGTAVLSATKDGYSAAQLTADLSDCQACLVNADCPATMQCASNQCIPVPCACGTVSDHQCMAFQCCADSDCALTEMCSNHACVPKQECTNDSDCAASERCDITSGAPGGSCVEVQCSCGTVSNHQCAAYECCADSDCAAGMKCQNNDCVQPSGDLSCPATGVVGGSSSCMASESGTACVNCDYEITNPSGKKTAGKTGSDGRFQLPLNTEGTYQVSLIKDGQIIKTIAVRALPGTTPSEEPPPTASTGPDIGMVIFLLVILGLVVFGILYWRRSQKK